MSNTRDIKQYINRTFLLEEVRLDEVKKVLLEVLEFLEFEIKEITESDQSFRLVTKYGTKSKAFLAGMFIPHGNHLPEGKRFFCEAKASITTEGIEINIHVVPLMELLDHKEVFLLTQGLTEKLTDDHMAAAAFRDIVRNLCIGLGLKVPEEFRLFDNGRTFWDHFWSFAIHPLQANIQIHMPSDSGPRWNWGAFILPEVWFLFNNIVGLAFLALFVDGVLLQLLLIPTILIGLHWLALGVPLLIASRMFFGRFAHRAYFARWGHWKGNTALYNEKIFSARKIQDSIHQVTRIKFDSSSVEALNNRGIAYGERDEYDLAIADFTKAIEVDPNNAYSYFNRALAYEEQGMKLEAIDDYKKFLAVNRGRRLVKDATLAIEELSKEINNSS